MGFSDGHEWKFPLPVRLLGPKPGKIQATVFLAPGSQLLSVNSVQQIFLEFLPGTWPSLGLEWFKRSKAVSTREVKFRAGLETTPKEMPCPI